MDHTLSIYNKLKNAVLSDRKSVFSCIISMGYVNTCKPYVDIQIDANGDKDVLMKYLQEIVSFPNDFINIRYGNRGCLQNKLS